MTVALLALLALVAVASVRNVNGQGGITLEDNTAYGYLTKVGIPKAEMIRKAEEQALQEQTTIAYASASDLDEFTYLAGLLVQTEQGQGVCGGSLVSTNRVLTAAHCWFDGITQGSNITVVLGSMTLFFGGTRVTTSNIVVHEDWNPNLVTNDIAIVSTEMNTSNKIIPIALPTGSELNQFSGVIATASGFGVTSQSNGIITSRRHINLTVIKNEVCLLSYPLLILPSNICTNSTIGNNAYSGVSGGPLTVTMNNRTILIGVISFGAKIDIVRVRPIVFARVTSYSTWINSHL